MSTRREDEKSPITEQIAVAKKVAQDTREEARKLREFAGDQPWNAPRLTAAQKMAAFTQVREDDEFWAKSLHRTGRMLHLSDGLVPREVVDEAEGLEAKYQEMRASGETPNGYRWQDDGTLTPDEPEEPFDDGEKVTPEEPEANSSTFANGSDIATTDEAAKEEPEDGGY